MLKRNKIYHGDCLKWLKKIDDNSIDMILCDLPYGGGKTSCKWDTPIPFEPMWEQLHRIIKHTRAIVLFGAEPFSSLLRTSNIKNYKYDWVWLKTKPTGYQIAKIKPLSRHENIHVFGKGKILYNPQMVERDKPRKGMVHSTNNQMKVSGGGIYKEYKNYTHKYPTSVLEFSNAVQKGKLHPTQKPVDLSEYLIKTYTNETNVVLDFTCGSGTTGVACINTNRSLILIEKEYDYCKISKERTGAKIVKFKTSK